MSQATVTDKKDVKKMKKEEIQQWIDSHKKFLATNKVDIIENDLQVLKEELKRRKNLKTYTDQDLMEWLNN